MSRAETDDCFLSYKTGGGCCCIEHIVRIVLRYSLSVVVLLFLFLPVLVILTIRKVYNGRNIFIVERVLGKKAAPISIVYFNTNFYPARILPLFFMAIEGRLRIIGLSIKPLDYERTAGDECLFNDKPGIISLLYIRQSTRIAHNSVFEIEREYLAERSFKYDLLLALKAIPALFYHAADLPLNDKVNLLDVEFDNLTMKGAVNLIKSTIIERNKRFICFVNPDCLNKIFTDREYFGILQAADNVFPDGIGINIACKMIKNQMRENINGTDMLPYLCEMCLQNGWGIYLLGAKPGVAEKMKGVLALKYPDLKVCGCTDGYFDRLRSDEVVERINSSGAEILLAAFGVPWQEKWLYEYKDRLNVSVMMGVGGLFDFYSGNIKRAPVWLREIGGEWIYRIVQEPARMWKRYIIGNPVFLYRVLRWKRCISRLNGD